MGRANTELEDIVYLTYATMFLILATSISRTPYYKRFPSVPHVIVM